MEQQFILELEKAGNDKEKLLQLMYTIDEEKRRIRSFMRRFSNEPKDNGGGSGAERYRKLRWLKTRIGQLVEEREMVRQKLGQIKGDKKRLNRAVNSRNLEFCRAFMAAAESVLSEQQFLDVEMRAMEMIEQVKPETSN